MKRKIRQVAYYFMIAGLIIHYGCSRKLTKGFNAERAIIQYDTAKFDWYFAEGTKQKLLGNAGQALKFMEECLAINQESDAAYYQVAQIMLNNGNILIPEHKIEYVSFIGWKSKGVSLVSNPCITGFYNIGCHIRK